MVLDMCLGKQTDLESDEWVSWNFFVFGKLQRIILKCSKQIVTTKTTYLNHFTKNKLHGHS